MRSATSSQRAGRIFHDALAATALGAVARRLLVELAAATPLLPGA